MEIAIGVFFFAILGGILLLAALIVLYKLFGRRGK